MSSKQATIHKRVYSLIHPVRSKPTSNPLNIFQGSSFLDLSSNKPYQALRFCTQPKDLSPKSNICTDINLLKYTDKNFKLKEEEEKRLQKRKRTLSKQQTYKVDEDKREFYSRIGLNGGRKVKNKKSFSAEIPRLSVHKKTLKDTRSVMQKNQDFYDFKGLIQEINSIKPLRQQFGDRYFELSLRERHKDEKKNNSFVYNIRNNNEPSSFVQRTRKMYPQIKARRRLILRGKHVKTQV